MAQPTKPPTSADIPNDKGDFASSLRGGLPFKKRKVSPFDRIGSRMWQDQKGQLPKSYAS